MSTPKTEPDWHTPPGTIIDSYDATPPSINMKCIVFSIIMVALYLLLPRNNRALLVLFIGTIISVLLYDTYYACDSELSGRILRPLVAGILMVLLLKFLPPRNKIILLGVLYFPYLIMAIYDYHFNCIRNQLGPTFLALFYSWAKPAYSTQIETYKKWHPHWKDMIRKVDTMVLVILLVLYPLYFNKHIQLPQLI
jgi:hypothetical protein